MICPFCKTLMSRPHPGDAQRVCLFCDYCGDFILTNTVHEIALVAMEKITSALIAPSTGFECGDDCEAIIVARLAAEHGVPEQAIRDAIGEIEHVDEN